MIRNCLIGCVILLLVPNLYAQFQPHVDYPTGPGPVAVAVGDFNGDGKPDIVVANYASGSSNNTVSVLLGKGDGTFKPRVDYTIGGTNPLWVTVGDFNRDGKLDVAVAVECGTYPSCSNDQNGIVSILLGNGDGTFQPHVDYATQIDPQVVVVADVNGDGIPDLVAANYGPDYGAGSVSILLGNGDGTFQPQRVYAAGTNPIGLVVGDFNHDGKPDLAVANNNGAWGVMILLGNGDGSFQAPVFYPTGANPRLGVVADFSSDGNLDLAVANCIDNDVSILFGDGNGHFSSPVNYPAGSWVAAIAGGDFDGDGKMDLVTVNAASNSVSFLKGNGDGTFQAQVTYPTGNQPAAIAVADLNHDGAPDLVVTNLADNTVSILMNKGPDFSIAASAATPGTVSRGQTSTSTLTFKLLTAFNNPVTLACAVQPAQSAPTCSFSKNPVPFDASGSATAMLTLTPSAEVASLESATLRHGSRQIPLLWLPVAGFALIGAGFSSRKGARKRLLACVLGSIVLGGLIFQAACAGVSSAPPPATTYTITVTGTSGLAQHSVTVTLTVQ